MFYKVTAKCGHVGRNNYIEKDFFVRADSGKDAALIVRRKPRVKHDRKDAILSVVQITHEEFFIGREMMKDDLYFCMKNSREQRLLNFINPDEIKQESQRTCYVKVRDKEYRLKRLRIMEIQSKQIVEEVFYEQA